MKITHNKIGQNLNVVDGTKSDRAAKANSPKSAMDIKGDIGGDSKMISAKTSGIDDSARVAVSPRAMEAKRIKDLALAAPDVDAEKVARFQKLIDDGKYKVDAKAVADRMVDEHLETAE